MWHSVNDDMQNLLVNHYATSHPLKLSKYQLIGVCLMAEIVVSVFVDDSTSRCSFMCCVPLERGRS